MGKIKEFTTDMKLEELLKSDFCNIVTKVHLSTQENIYDLVEHDYDLSEDSTFYPCLDCKVLSFKIIDDSTFVVLDL